MRATLDIALKDLRQRLRDRSALLIGVVAPFSLAALFSLVLGGLDEDFHGHWAYVDLDGGELSTALREGPLAALQAEDVIQLTPKGTGDEARAAIEAGEEEAAIVVPEGFSAGYMAGGGGSVELVVDPDAAISAQVARSVLAGFAAQADAVQLSVLTSLATGDGLPTPALIEAVSAEAVAMADPVRLVDAAVADRQAGWATYYAGAMAILFVFLAAQFGIVSVHAERRTKTLARILAAPLRWQSIITAKLIVSMVLALVSLTVIVVGTALLLGATWGDPLAMGALMLAAALAATGISLLTVAFTRNEEQAGSAIAIVSFSLAVIGGSFFPANQGPELLSQLSLVAPHAWFLDGVNDISTGGDVGTAALPIAVLALIGLVTGGMGMLRARRLVIG